MNTEQINFLSNLDPTGMNGTTSSILFSQDIEKFDYVKTLESLLKATVGEKSIIKKEQMKLIQFIKDKGLDISEVEVQCLDL